MENLLSPDEWTIAKRLASSVVDWQRVLGKPVDSLHSGDAESDGDGASDTASDPGSGNDSTVADDEDEDHDDDDECKDDGMVGKKKQKQKQKRKQKQTGSRASKQKSEGGGKATGKPKAKSMFDKLKAPVWERTQKAVKKMAAIEALHPRPPTALPRVNGTIHLLIKSVTSLAIPAVQPLSLAATATTTLPVAAVPPASPSKTAPALEASEEGRAGVLDADVALAAHVSPRVQLRVSSVAADGRTGDEVVSAFAPTNRDKCDATWEDLERVLSVPFSAVGDAASGGSPLARPITPSNHASRSGAAAFTVVCEVRLCPRAGADSLRVMCSVMLPCVCVRACECLCSCGVTAWGSAPYNSAFVGWTVDPSWMPSAAVSCMARSWKQSCACLVRLSCQASSRSSCFVARTRLASL